MWPGVLLSAIAELGFLERPKITCSRLQGGPKRPARANRRIPHDSASRRTRAWFVPRVAILGVPTFEQREEKHLGRNPELVGCKLDHLVCRLRILTSE